MPLERRIIAVYDVTEEPVSDGSTNFGFINGDVHIAPRADPGRDRHLTIHSKNGLSFYRKPTDLSRIANSDPYRGRVSADFTIPDELVNSQLSVNEYVKIMLDTVYPILTRIIEDDKTHQ